ncbi:glycoprotein [Odrenisrou virus]|uniref:Envelopment polyprotein n=1 Tax=Odrenisrou virus TaxID=1048855 RepID=I1T352_9VIRU|nr:glycoprotein [Odrenisrou virus]AEL29669.1 glycoprotein [Odrenisrou virus]
MHQITVISGPTEVSSCFGGLYPLGTLKSMMGNAMKNLEGKIFCSVGGRSIEEDEDGVLSLIDSFKEDPQDQYISCHGTPKLKVVEYKKHGSRARGEKHAVDCVTGTQIGGSRRRGDLNALADRVQSEITTSPAPTVKTTVKAIVLAALLATAVVRGDPHLDNRPGSGTYGTDSANSGTNCSPLKYDSNCASWELQKDKELYPFFNTFPYKYSLIEAIPNSLVHIDEANVCKVTTSSPANTVECLKSLRSIKFSCPSGFKSAYFVHSDGKVRGIKCDTQHQLTPDCMFCQKTEDNSQPKDIISLQDAVCQAIGTEYNGPIMRIPGYCKIGDTVLRDCSQKDVMYERMAFLVMRNKKLYVPSLIIQSLDSISLDHIRCYRHKKQHGVGDSSSDVKDLISIKPTECKQMDSTKVKKCTGDEIFCSHFECDKERPDTYCFYANGSGIIQAQYNGVWVHPVCLGYETVLVEKQRLVEPVLRATDCASCVVKCREEEIEVNSNGFLITSAIACYHGECLTKTQAPRQVVKILKSPSLKVHGGEVGIHLSTEGEEPSYHVTAKCEAMDPCKAYSCFFCWENALNFHCHTAISSLILALSIGSISSVIIGSLYKLSKGTVFAVKYGRNPILWAIRFVVWLFYKLKTKVFMRFKKLNEKIEHDVEMQNFTIQQPSRPKLKSLKVETGASSGPTRVKPINYYLYGATIMLGLIQNSYCCSENVIASSKISSCFIESGKHVCKLSGVINLRVGTIGSESCLMVKGPLEGQVEAIRIKTKSSELVCQEGSSFWTNHFAPTCYSSRRCHLVGECVGSKCLEWNSSVVSQEFRSMTEPHLMVENVCFEQCGGIGCSCFNVNPSCLFGLTILKPTYKKAVKVFQCASWSHRISLEISAPRLPTKTLTLSSLSTQIAEWGSITLSVDADSMVDNNNLSFLKTHDGEYALIEDVMTTSPTKGHLGEVRCQTEQQATVGSSSCLRADKLVDYRPQYNILSCTSKLIDPHAILKRNGLPQKRGKYMYTPSIGLDTIQAISQGVIEATMTLTLDNYEVSFLSDKAECSASFINITGCYSCYSGANLCFRVSASTSASFVARSKDETKVFSKTIPHGLSEHCSLMHYSAPVVDEVFEYSCGSEWKKIQVHGNLVLLSLTDDHIEGGSSIIVSPSSGSFSMLGWFNGLLSWLGGPLKAFLLILLYVVITIVLLVTVITVLKFGLRSLILKKHN